MWIAEFSESSNLWTQIALSGYPGSTPVWASFKNLHTPVWVGSSCDFFLLVSGRSPVSRCVWTRSCLLLHCSEGSTCFCPSVVRCSFTPVFIHSVRRKLFFWPQIRRDYPLNLSILISGGKETNKDSPSNGEWSGTSSNLKSPLLAAANCSLEERFQGECAVLKLLGTAHRRGWQSRTRYCASFTMRFLWVGLLGNAAQIWR